MRRVANAVVSQTAVWLAELYPLLRRPQHMMKRGNNNEQVRWPMPGTY